MQLFFLRLVLFISSDKIPHFPRNLNPAAKHSERKAPGTPNQCLTIRLAKWVCDALTPRSICSPKK